MCDGVFYQKSFEWFIEKVSIIVTNYCLRKFKARTILLFKNSITTLWSLILHGIAFNHFDAQWTTTNMYCKSGYHHHWLSLKGIQSVKQYYSLKILSLLCDHWFCTELLLTTLTHNREQPICIESQKKEERIL